MTKRQSRQATFGFWISAFLRHCTALTPCAPTSNMAAPAGKRQQVENSEAALLCKLVSAQTHRLIGGLLRGCRLREAGACGPSGKKDPLDQVLCFHDSTTAYIISVW